MQQTKVTSISVISATRDAKWCLDVESDISYGSTERQKLDVYTQKDSAGKKGQKNLSLKHVCVCGGGGEGGILYCAFNPLTAKATQISYSQHRHKSHAIY